MKTNIELNESARFWLGFIYGSSLMAGIMILIVLIIYSI